MSMDDFVRFCCGDPDCPNPCEREQPPVAADRLPDPAPCICPQEFTDAQCPRHGIVATAPPVSAAVSPAEPPEAKRELTEYEKGYLDGVLAYSYRGSDGEVYVGRNRLRTYSSAALGFLKSRGIDTKGWKVNVR